MVDFINSDLGSWAIVIGMLVLMVAFRRRTRRDGTDGGFGDTHCDGDGGD